ncbi:MAG: hypothetical protein KAH23_07080, partial [Kiritimatiellae bacterium]|nr:hypothetical protein [Kiritimatiellia bacterium]
FREFSLLFLYILESIHLSSSLSYLFSVCFTDIVICSSGTLTANNLPDATANSLSLNDLRFSRFCEQFRPQKYKKLFDTTAPLLYCDPSLDQECIVYPAFRSGTESDYQI